MSEERNFVIRFITDTGEALSGVNTFFSGLDGGVERAKRAFNTLQQAAEAVGNVISKGDAFLNVQASFNKIQAAAGNTAGIEKLRAAVGGVISDFELMKSANAAASFGVTADQFQRLAAQADSLADIMGGDAVDALNAMTRAAGTGEARMLKTFNVVVDGAKNSEEMVSKLEAQISKLAAESGSAGDAADSLKVALANQADKAAAAFTKSKELAQVLESLAKFVNSADWTTWINDFGKGLVVLQDTAVKTGQSFNRLFEALQGINTDESAQIEFAKRIAEGIQKQVGGWKAVKAETKEVAQGVGVVFNATEKAAKATEEAAKKQEEWNKTVRELDTTELANGIKDAIENLNEADFSSYKAQIYKNAYDGFIEAHKDLAGSSELATQAQRFAEITVDPYTKEFIDSSSERADAEAEKLKEAYQEAVDFWTDTFADALNGEFELDNLEDALKRVAAGFAGSIMAGMVGAPQGANSAQGWGNILGQMAMSYMGGGSGGGMSMGNMASWGSTAAGLYSTYFGGSAVAAGSSASGIAAGGAAASGAGSAAGGGAAAAPAAGSAGMAASAGWLALLYGIYLTADAYFDSSSAINSGDATDEEMAYISNHGHSPMNLSPTAWGLTAAFGGKPQDYSPSGALLGAFNGSEQLLFERLAREQIIEWLEDQYGDGHDFAINGVGGGNGMFQQMTLDPTAFDVNQNPRFPEGELGGQAVGLMQGMADIFAQGDDKLGDDLAGIFANAILQGENFNEVLINGNALLEQFGMTAEEGKNQLTDLFLDGSVSLEEFGAGIQGFNTLATENLVGEGSVNDALNIIFNNLETKPRIAVKGLELLWQELGEQGITTLQGFSDYLGTTFNVDAQAAFDAIAAAGITSFENLATLSADQLFALLNSLTTITGQMQEALGGDISAGANQGAAAMERLNQKIRETGQTFATVMSNAANNAAEDVDRAARQMVEALNAVEEAADDAGAAVDGAGGGGGGRRPNTNTDAVSRRGVYPSINRLNRAEL